jgi:hypothetical protein
MHWLLKVQINQENTMAFFDLPLNKLKTYLSTRDVSATKTQEYIKRWTEID